MKLTEKEFIKQASQYEGLIFNLLSIKEGKEILAYIKNILFKSNIIEDLKIENINIITKSMPF